MLRKIATTLAFCLLATPALAERGIASLYLPGGINAGGQPSTDGLKAAHKTLPLGTKVEVTNLDNGMKAEVTITDRGPYIPGRIIDLKPMAARAIGCGGLANVEVDVIGCRRVRVRRPIRRRASIRQL